MNKLKEGGVAHWGCGRQHLQEGHAYMHLTHLLLSAVPNSMAAVSSLLAMVYHKYTPLSARAHKGTTAGLKNTILFPLIPHYCEKATHTGLIALSLCLKSQQLSNWLNAMCLGTHIPACIAPQPPSHALMSMPYVMCMPCWRTIKK